jgi:hypothetical protein
MVSSTGTLWRWWSLFGSLAVIKGNSFVNSRDSDQSEISERFFVEIHQTDVVQKEFHV